MSVQAYEVKLHVRNNNTKESSTRMRTEYAYNVMDALTQAVFNETAIAGSAEIKVSVKAGTAQT